jgi:hypothetical protein
VNAKLRQQLRKRKRKLLRRISVEHGKWQSPMIRPATTKVELAEKQQAVTCGGLAAIVELIKTLELRKATTKLTSMPSEQNASPIRQRQVISAGDSATCKYFW